MKTHSRFRVARGFLIFWCLFIGVGALFGAGCMLFDPTGVHTGMDGLLPGLQKLPLAEILFQKLTFAGTALLCVNGLPNLLAASLMLARRKAGVVCGTVFGGTLMAWICIQFFIFPANPLSIAYFIFGVLQLLTGFAALIFYAQEHFTVAASDYPNIGTNPKHLVVYFSRLGYTRRAALEAANRTGAQVYEVKSTERTAGTMGFWWCGRFAMHRWNMPIEAPTLPLSEYAQVTLCTPIWAFHIAAPMRSFCDGAKGQLSQADAILTHFQRFRYRYVVRELEAQLGLELTGAESICCRWGHVIHREQLKTSGETIK